MSKGVISLSSLFMLFDSSLRASLIFLVIFFCNYDVILSPKVVGYSFLGFNFFTFYFFFLFPYFVNYFETNNPSGSCSPLSWSWEHPSPNCKSLSMYSFYFISLVFLSTVLEALETSFSFLAANTLSIKSDEISYIVFTFTYFDLLSYVSSFDSSYPL